MVELENIKSGHISLSNKNAKGTSILSRIGKASIAGRDPLDKL
jgi:hypothetical protein